MGGFDGYKFQYSLMVCEFSAQILSFLKLYILSFRFLSWPDTEKTSTLVKALRPNYASWCCRTLILRKMLSEWQRGALHHISWVFVYDSFILICRVVQMLSCTSESWLNAAICIQFQAGET